MQLSSDDLPMFFTEAHVRLAEQLRAVALAFAAIEAPGAHADDAARDRAAVAALAEAGLFELVVPRTQTNGVDDPPSASSSGGESRPSAGPVGAGPRDATRGGGNGPALPVQRGRESPLSIDLRAVCLAREMLGYVSPRADSILVCQGLGTHAIGAAGSAEQRGELAAFGRGE